MTVSYTAEVATSKGFGCFWKLLFRWRGSIYKLVWPDLLVYTFLFYSCNLSYRFALNEEQKRSFERVSQYCQYFSDLIPISFVLGFYVTLVVQRWWAQYEMLPWPDAMALFISTSIHGQDERSRLMRRTVMRYINISFVMTLSMTSPRVKKRFPTLDHVVDAGFMTKSEKKILEDLEKKTQHQKYFVPLVWAGSIVARARKEGRIRDDFAVKTIIDEINKYRGLCCGLLSYDWISIPLVYTQVVTLAVYTFFLGTIMGRQFLDPTQNEKQIDIFIPIFTFLQFFFYMGWLKVAESLVNPFGEDDEDFEVNWLVDRHLQVSYLIVDEMHSEYPELEQDIYWDEVFPAELPYTIASEQFRREPPQGSTANVEVPNAEMEFLPLLEEENGDINRNLSGIRIDSKGETMRSSQTSIDRKPSVLSMFIKKVSSKTYDGGMPTSGRAHGSNISMRGSMAASRNKRGSSSRITRNASRPSLGSTSPASIGRVATATLNCDSNSLIMSDMSLDKMEDVSPDKRTSGEDSDEPLYINIKRRDKDGRVIIGYDDYEDNKSKRKSLKKHYKRETQVSVWSDNNPGGEGSDASDCSIRTSIFTGENDECQGKSQSNISRDAHSSWRKKRRRAQPNHQFQSLSRLLTPTTSPKHKQMLDGSPDEYSSDDTASTTPGSRHSTNHERQRRRSLPGTKGLMESNSRSEPAIPEKCLEERLRPASAKTMLNCQKENVFLYQKDERLRKEENAMPLPFEGDFSLDNNTVSLKINDFTNDGFEEYEELQSADSSKSFNTSINSSMAQTLKSDKQDEAQANFPECLSNIPLKDSSAKTAALSWYSSVESGELLESIAEGDGSCEGD